MKFLRTKLVSSFKSRHSQSKTQARHKSSERIVLIGKTNIGFFLSQNLVLSFFITQVFKMHIKIERLRSEYLPNIGPNIWCLTTLKRILGNYQDHHRMNMILHTLLHSCWIENLPQFGNEKGLIAPFPTFPDDNTTSNFSTTRLRIISYFCFSQRKVQSRWKQNQKQKNICDFVVLTSVLISRNSCWMKKFLSIVRCWLLKLF